MTEQEFIVLVAGWIWENPEKVVTWAAIITAVLTKLPHIGPKVATFFRKRWEKVLEPVLREIAEVHQKQDNLMSDHSCLRTMVWHQTSFPSSTAFKVDSDGSLVRATPSIWDISADIDGPSFQNIFYNGDRLKFEAAVKHAVTKGASIVMKVTLVDGKEYDLRGTPIPVENKSYLGVYCTLHPRGVGA
jgi:hypothetical protein